MIYIHVPFCRSFCTYCGFYSEICRGDEAVDAYVEALCAEIIRRSGEFARTSVNTLYIGGGTPSVLPLSAFERILSTLAGAGSDLLPCMAVAGSKGAWDEFTVEVNPDDIVHKGLEYARGLRNLGVTRISMGVQSFDDGLLHWMNRRHKAADAVEAYHILQEAGFENISIDLIFGLGDFGGSGGIACPGSGAVSSGVGSGRRAFTDELWADTIDRALSLHPAHISAYQLSIEPDSALEKMVSRGSFVPADENRCAAQYDLLCRRLAEAGYHHYEISNFALPGREAVHNSAYWNRTPYVGLGPAAHSLRMAGASDAGPSSGAAPVWRRSWNPADLKAYCQGAQGGFEDLTAEQIEMEDIMLGLRTDEGVPAEMLGGPAAGEPQTSVRMRTVGRLLASGDLVRVGDRIRIPESRFFVSDAIIGEIV